MQIRIHYPLDRGTLKLRTDQDWDRDIAPSRARSGGRFEFELGKDGSFRYLKPVLQDGAEVRWAQGNNVLAVAGKSLDVFPYFDPDASCHVCQLHRVPASFGERGYEVRVFVPPGYDENVLERFPVLYMQDGQNLFFPNEAFGGAHWRVAETLAVLRSMNLVRQVLVVGVYPQDRMRDFTAPGYDAYAAFLAKELKPWVDAHYRTLPAARHNAVLGSSLGGVVSLHTALTHPMSFGNAGCMSSTFGYRDDLIERVLNDARRRVRIYLDTGWPGDNYETNRVMRAALVRRGYREGKQLRYNAFPDAHHNEQSWAQRLHLPIQFFFGAD